LASVAFVPAALAALASSFSDSGLAVALLAAGCFLADARVDALGDFALADDALLVRDFDVDRLLDD
jgi:hypothetical protein